MAHLYEAYMKYKYETGSCTSGDDPMERDEPIQRDPRDPMEFSIAVLGLSGKRLIEGCGMTLRPLHRLRTITGLSPSCPPPPLP